MQGLILPVTTSFLLSCVATYLVRIVAVKLRWISIPREERWNTRVVALMGGIGVFVSFSISYFLFLSFQHSMVLAGGTLLFAAGFWDDRTELKPIAKFLIQFLAASLLIGSGYTLSSSWPFWISIPVTYLWILGITNAFNLLDNMDGLAAGIAVITSLAWGALAFYLNMPQITLLSFLLAGAIGGFLVFNYNPAKIFMGDCGSLFIGYLLAALPLMLEPALTNAVPSGILPVCIALAIIPIFDTTLVTLVRLFKGRSPARGGSDHSSHRLVFSGLTERSAVHTLYLIGAFFALTVVLFYPAYPQLFYLLFTISLIGLLFFGSYLSRLDVYGQDSLSTIESMVQSIPAYLKRNAQLASIIVDITLIIASLALAHFIRFEGWSLEIEQALMEVLPGIIILKILLFSAIGLYQRVWRYAGVADLARLMIGAFAGSAAGGVFAWIYSGGYLSASVFAIDAFLFMFLIACSRFAFKGLRRLFAIPQSEGENVLLYGAGDGGWLALSEIRQNPNLQLNPVGFIDDSQYKQRGKVQGLRVLGDYQDLISVCVEFDVGAVLICIRNLKEEKKAVIKKLCADNNITCREFIPSFAELKTIDHTASSDSYSNIELQNENAV